MKPKFELLLGVPYLQRSSITTEKARKGSREAELQEEDENVNQFGRVHTDILPRTEEGWLKYNSRRRLVWWTIQVLIRSSVTGCLISRSPSF